MNFLRSIGRLAWLFLDLFQRRRATVRGLFRYWDGQRWRYADPFALWRQCVGHPAMAKAPRAEAGIEPDATEVLEALVSIFGVPRWHERDGRGLTDWEVFDLVRQFEAHLETLKKTTDPGRMPLLLSALGSSTSPAGPGAAKRPSSDCGSTAAGSTDGASTNCSRPSATP